jgi:hypothetical protein
MRSRVALYRDGENNVAAPPPQTDDEEVRNYCRL